MSVVSAARARVFGDLGATVDRRRLEWRRHKVGPETEPDVMAQPFRAGASGAPQIGVRRGDRFTFRFMTSP